MRRGLGLALAFGLLATLLGIPASAAQLHRWTGRVTHIADGDTFDVDIAGDGTSTPKRIRLTGVQAMEIGECHSKAAANRLEALIGGKTVRLTAQDPNSLGLHDRLVRQVEYKSGGSWRDVGIKLLAEGHALWMPHPTETRNHEGYNRAASSAAAKRLRLWDTDSCAPGPQQSARLRVWVQWDADSNDGQNLNGEWVKLYNPGGGDLRLDGWRLRDTALRGHSYFVFPAGTVLRSGNSLTVHVGKGENTATRLYWGQSAPVFENAVTDGRSEYIGDGAYLFDRDGDLRWWFTYPCALGCTDKLQGKVALTRVEYDPPGEDTALGEYVDVTNVSPARVQLYGYLLESWPYGHAFPRESALEPGQTLRVRIGRGVDEGAQQYWGLPSSVLANTGDVVQLRTFDLVRLDCHAWGQRSC